MKLKQTGILLILAAVMISPVCGKAAQYADNFNNMDNWLVDHSYLPPKLESTLGAAHAPYAHVFYALTKSTLPETLTSEFRVNFKWLLKGRTHQGWIWMLNSTGTAGYGLRWTAGPDTDRERPGYINIYKYDNTAEYTRSVLGTAPWTLTSLLPTSVYLKGDAIALPFADVEFTWRASDGRLTFKVTDAFHGGVEAEAFDMSFSSFSKIYMHAYGATGEMYVDNLVVRSKIEPTACQPDVGENGYSMAADLNEDCRVDMKDVWMLTLQWMLCNNPGETNCITTW